jgi:hypothetical protein
LAGVLRRLDDRPGAATAYAEALHRNRWSHYALTGRAGALEVLERPKAAAACRTLDSLLRTERTPPNVDRLQDSCFG